MIGAEFPSSSLVSFGNEGGARWPCPAFPQARFAVARLNANSQFEFRLNESDNVAIQTDCAVPFPFIITLVEWTDTDG